MRMAGLNATKIRRDARAPKLIGSSPRMRRIIQQKNKNSIIGKI
jgi:hypothetical protein